MAAHWPALVLQIEKEQHGRSIGQQLGRASELYNCDSPTATSTNVGHLYHFAPSAATQPPVLTESRAFCACACACLSLDLRATLTADAPKSPAVHPNLPACVFVRLARLSVCLSVCLFV